MYKQWNFYIKIAKGTQEMWSIQAVGLSIQVVAKAVWLHIRKVQNHLRINPIFSTEVSKLSFLKYFLHKQRVQLQLVFLYMWLQKQVWQYVHWYMWVGTMMREGVICMINHHLDDLLKRFASVSPVCQAHIAKWYHSYMYYYPATAYYTKHY